MVKKYLKLALVFLWLITITLPLHSQVKHTHDIVLGSLQLKEKLDLGVVFNGGQLEYRYGAQWKINNHEIQYQPQLGVGLAFYRKMLGTQIHIAPINARWAMQFYEKNGHTIRGGVNFVTDYNYQFYELRDGPIFWTTEMGLSPVIRYGYQWNNKQINVGLQNSLLGFTSHRQGYDSYMWSFTWKDFIVYPHKDMKFGSFNHYNHTKVSIEFVPNISKKHSFAYEFDYLGFYYGNTFARINHNLIWRITLCKNKEK
jgi:hypothetical protein